MPVERDDVSQRVSRCFPQTESGCGVIEKSVFLGMCHLFPNEQQWSSHRPTSDPLSCPLGSARRQESLLHNLESVPLIERRSSSRRAAVYSTSVTGRL